MKRNLNDIRAKFASISNTANDLYNTLSQINPSSQAIYDADRSMKSSNVMPFDLSDKKRFREIQRELRRAEQFIRDAKAEGFSKNEVNPARWAKKFGNQYKKEYGQSYSPELNDTFANMAFEAYRRVESDMAAQIEAYGSDTLIQYLYDFIDITPSLMFMSEDDRIESIKLKAQQMLIDLASEKKASAELELTIGSNEYGLLQSSKSSKEFRSKLKW